MNTHTGCSVTLSAIATSMRVLVIISLASLRCSSARISSFCFVRCLFLRGPVLFRVHETFSSLPVAFSYPSQFLLPTLSACALLSCSDLLHSLQNVRYVHSWLLFSDGCCQHLNYVIFFLHPQHSQSLLISPPCYSHMYLVVLRRRIKLQFVVSYLE